MDAKRHPRGRWWGSASPSPPSVFVSPFPRPLVPRPPGIASGPARGPASLPKASAAAIPAAVAASRTYITSSFTHPG